ncbi:NACHT domain-containing protein [Pendulispora albinea]|uniref:NACHT domain-containing protein n=1 Tax=Pendulispora albinea TaxID=2741071 RepID=A0ABZ2M7U8_9BACT
MQPFIIYSQDSPEHVEQVRRLAHDLAQAGIPCDIDLLAKTPAEGWRLWAEERARTAEITLIVVTAPFARRIEAAVVADGTPRHDAKLAAGLLAPRHLPGSDGKSVFVIVPDDVSPAVAFTVARWAPSFRYPSDIARIRATLAVRAASQSGGGARTLSATMQTAPRKTPSSGRGTSASWYGPEAAARLANETLVSVYERSGASDVFVRPSGDTDTGTVDDLVAYAKQAILHDPSALVLLLGNYGSGKSYAAQRLAYELAKDYLAGHPGVPATFYLNLSFARAQMTGPDAASPGAALAKAISLFAARYNMALSERELLEILTAGPATALVLDGLDEMGERIKREETPKFAAALEELRKIPGLRVFLTCRTTFYKESVDDDQIPATRKITLLPFDDRQIETYLARASSAVRARLIGMLDRVPRLRDLCRTPIHLFLSQEYVAERSDVSADFRLIDLYDAFVRKNLAVHATTNPGWSPRARRAFVRSLAYHMFDEGLIEMSTDELVRVLSEELPDATPAERAETATQIKNCSFFVRAGATFRPLHLSFLEYFVAEVLVEELYEGNIEKWNRRPLYAEVFDFMIQMIQRRGRVDLLPVQAIVNSETQEAPSNFIATMYRWAVPEVRPSFEKLLLEGKWGLVRCTASSGIGMYNSPDVVPCLLASFDTEKNTILRAVVQRLLQRLRDLPQCEAEREDIDARLAIALPLVHEDAEDVLHTKKSVFPLQAYRKALLFGDGRPSSTIAAVYLLAGVNDTESFPDIERIGHASRIPAIRSAYEHARALAPLSELPELPPVPPPPPPQNESTARVQGSPGVTI